MKVEFVKQINIQYVLRNEIFIGNQECGNGVSFQRSGESPSWIDVADQP
jgi:hypothetical protein